MNNKKGGFGAKLLLVIILMLASAVGGAYGYRVADGKLAARDAMKAVENVDVSDYDTAEQTEIQGYINDAKKNLETAKTRKEVYEVISVFIADVDKVQTKSEKELEAALRAAEEAKKQQQQYSQNNGNSNYSNGNSGYDSSNNGSYGNSTDANNGSYDSSTPEEAQDSGEGSTYKSNDLNPGSDGTESSGSGILGSLLGGMTSGSSGDTNE